jgi:hypothetical protein
VNGLEGDEQVVIGGQHRVRDGLRVEVSTVPIDAEGAPAAEAPAAP